MAVTKRTRYEVLRRDNFTCRYCRSTDGEMTIDHVVPIALGGTDDPGNLVAACRDCNAGKTSTQPDAQTVTDVSEDALRWAQAMKQAGELLEAKAEPGEAYARLFEERWGDYHTGGEFNRKPIYKPSGWRDSLAAFRKAGLPESSMLRAVDKAMGKDNVRPDDTFRYFCGICWRMIGEIQTAARDLIATEDVESGS